MLGARLTTYHPSLRRWSRALAFAWLAGAGLMVPVSIVLLDQICDDAQSTYTREIPSVLDRSRKAIKLERLASFMRMIVATRDPTVERRFLLQLQTLAQGFDLDDDEALSRGADQVIASARRVVALHGKRRQMEAAAGGAGGAAGRLDVERQAEQVGEETIQALDALTDHVTTDAALTADGMANRIQLNASRVRRGCLALLGVCFSVGALALWAFQRHVLAPIAAAVRGLEAIGRAGDTVVKLPPSRFSELDTIGRSVELYAQFAGELRAANLALRTLSEQDGLTGLANRRSFDLDLGDACRRAAEASGSFALLLIDIDHFKLLNDRFGHLAGDQCLRLVATTLQRFCSRCGGRAARYGGEEFAVLLPDVSGRGASDMAEQLRTAVEQADHRIDGLPCAITASIGVTPVADGVCRAPEQVIEAADEALYRAKRDGRNRVRTAGLDDSGPVLSQSAA